MVVLILHYHLHPGGVTKMIENQILALRSVDSAQQIKILCGNPDDFRSVENVEIFSDPVLDYAGETASPEAFADMVNAIKKLIKLHLHSSDILHGHNANLGKNAALTMALSELVSEGYSVVNHCHDFAEDRPLNLTLLEKSFKNYTSLSVKEILYPNEPVSHFVVLNSCDKKRMTASGISPDKIHLLPNPVVFEDRNGLKKMRNLKREICQALHTDENLKLCTYPVRAITRKNLGEFILMAVLFSDTANFVVTLAPKNPQELTLYNRWKDFCRQNHIRLIFEASDIVKYEELVAASDFCVTTSIREGFGLTFVEPWASETPVIGRELPCIVEDLKNYGMIFPRLYNCLMTGKVDFKDLSFEEQTGVIFKALNNKSYRTQILSDNQFLSTWLDPVSQEIVQNNRKIVQHRFSIEKYGERLFEIYRSISA